MLDDRPLTVFGSGQALRDFTYIDDIVESVVRVARKPATPNVQWHPDYPDPSTSRSPWRVLNVGHGHQATVARLIDILEELIGKPATREYEAEQLGDVPVTHADVEDLAAYVGYRPEVTLEEGLARFVKWLVEYRQ